MEGDDWESSRLGRDWCERKAVPVTPVERGPHPLVVYSLSAYSITLGCLSVSAVAMPATTSYAIPKRA